MRTTAEASGTMALLSAFLLLVSPGLGPGPGVIVPGTVEAAEPNLPPAATSPMAPALQSGQVGEPVPLHPEAEEAISRLHSPWCPGFMLEVCPSPNAAAFRDTLRLMAAQGIEADSLVEWTLARHGEEWRALPRAQGTGLLAWIIPPLVLAIGVVLVVVVLRRLRRRPSGGDGDGDRGQELSEDEERRLAEALREFEEEGH